MLTRPITKFPQAWQCSAEVLDDMTGTTFKGTPSWQSRLKVFDCPFNILLIAMDLSSTCLHRKVPRNIVSETPMLPDAFCNHSLTYQTKNKQMAANADVIQPFPTVQLLVWPVRPKPRYKTTLSCLGCSVQFDTSYVHFWGCHQSNQRKLKRDFKCMAANFTVGPSACFFSLAPRVVMVLSPVRSFWELRFTEKPRLWFCARCRIEFLNLQ